MLSLCFVACEYLPSVVDCCMMRVAFTPPLVCIYIVDIVENLDVNFIAHAGFSEGTTQIYKVEAGLSHKDYLKIFQTSEQRKHRVLPFF